MAFPTTGELDNFNRANNASLGPGWTRVDSSNTVLNLMNVNANTARPTGSNSSAMYWNPLPGLTDCEAFVQIVTLPVGDGGGGGPIIGASAGVLLRQGGVGAAGASIWDGYLVAYEHGGPRIAVYRIVDLAFTQLASTSLVISAGHWLGAQMTGSTLKVFHSTNGTTWTQVGANVVDTTLTAGYLGLWLGDSTGALDGFGGGAVVAVVTASFDFVTVI